MKLIIDTTNGILVELKEKNRIIAKFINNEKSKQSELLLVGIKEVLKKSRKKLKDIKNINVVNQGGSFTSLRIGISTANALGYALNVPVFAIGIKANRRKIGSLVMPAYDREPNITIKKKI